MPSESVSRLVAKAGGVVRIARYFLRYVSRLLDKPEQRRTMATIPIIESRNQYRALTNAMMYRVSLLEHVYGV
jgi:hypothetical protein